MPASRLTSTSLWPEARALIARVVDAASRDQFVDDCLDALVELFGADRGVVLLADGAGASLAINARGQGRALSAYEREEISRTIVDDARRHGAPLLWEPPYHGPPPSAAALGIWAALVAPLRVPARSAGAGPREVGVIYLDFRDPRHVPGATDLEFLGAAADLISVVLDGAERAARAQEDLRAALAGADRGPPPSLDELLRPPSMAAIRAELDTCLHSDLPILMLGESGTGKTLLAGAIAAATGRTPVVRATLGSSDDLNTITSELFGHERGAFSGALGRRTGLVEFADGGTLILDEVLNLPAHAQQLLLDFTQFGQFRPLGWPKPEPKTSRVRLIAATNGDLPAAIAAGRFRDDLYHRLAMVTVTLPPLRARRDDLPALAESLLRRADRARAWRLDLDARRALLSPRLAWPGNLRRLEAVVQRARLRALARDPSAEVIALGDLDLREPGVPAAGAPASPEVVELGAAWRALVGARGELDARERALLE
ncbi:MAG TPA: sigma 54-interacting transcriptional regulator, partial [Kofleriaceae bacterium]|nr:sigma 54-interacting transcriptional regulator [Kofleriaceae bacterium]